MAVLATALVRSLSAVMNIMTLMIVARAVLSWVPMGVGGEFMYKLKNMLYQLTEFLIAPIRSLLNRTPLGNMPIDFSPVIALFAIQIIGSILIQIVILVLM
ncbi:MAG: YggT family protein [Clostridia bacterium]|nr:YggT family protein [Clostridia bacterium]